MKDYRLDLGLGREGIILTWVPDTTSRWCVTFQIFWDDPLGKYLLRIAMIRRTHFCSYRMSSSANCESGVNNAQSVSSVESRYSSDLHQWKVDKGLHSYSCAGEWYTRFSDWDTLATKVPWISLTIAMSVMEEHLFVRVMKFFVLLLQRTHLHIDQKCRTSSMNISATIQHIYR